MKKSTFLLTLVLIALVLGVLYNADDWLQRDPTAGNGANTEPGDHGRGQTEVDPVDDNTAQADQTADQTADPPPASDSAGFWDFLPGVGDRKSTRLNSSHYS